MAAEKRGDTGKLEYDFPQQAACEVCIDETWYRVTERDFRSFDGPRRYTQEEYVKKGVINTPMKTYSYEGPVYMWGTNTSVPYEGTEKVITSPALDEQRKLLNSRPW